MQVVQERKENISSLVFLASTNKDLYVPSYVRMVVYPVGTKTYVLDVYQVVDSLQKGNPKVDSDMGLIVHADGHYRT